MNRLIFNQDNCIRFYTKGEASDEEASTACTEFGNNITSLGGNSEMLKMFLNFKEINVLNESESSTYLNGLGYSTEDSTTLYNGRKVESKT